MLAAGDIVVSFDYYFRSTDCEEMVLPPPPKLFPIEQTCGMQLFGQAVNYSPDSRTSVEPRKFSFYSIIHVIEGSAWYWSESHGRSAVAKSQILITAPGTLHDFAPGNDGAKIDMICLCGPTADNLATSGVLENGIFEFGQNRQLVSIIETSFQATKDKHLQAVVDLISIMTNYHFSLKNNNAGQTESKISNLIDLIKRNPEKWWDCGEMAEYCFISEAQLRRLFKKETGYSPKVFLDQVKIDHATELLKKGFSVGNVSDLLEYSDQFHFSRRFKAIKGLSPRDFLAQY